MTWQAARAESLRLVEQITAQHGRPTDIRLTIYVTDAAYQSAQPGTPTAWSRAFHTQVVRAVQRDLLKRGYTVHLEAIE